MGEEECRHSFQGQRYGRKQKEFGAKRYVFMIGEIGDCFSAEENDSVEMEKVISWEQKEVEAGEM